jgi:hypothetical protein
MKALAVDLRRAGRALTRVPALAGGAVPAVTHEEISR